MRLRDRLAGFFHREYCWQCLSWIWGPSVRAHVGSGSYADFHERCAPQWVAARRARGLDPVTDYKKRACGCAATNDPRYAGKACAKHAAARGSSAGESPRGPDRGAS